MPPPTPVKYHTTTFTIPGNTFLAPFGPNAEGTVPGFYADSDGNYHGFIFRDGTVTTVDAPGWDQTVFSGINDLGIVSGDSWDDTGSGGNPAFLYNLWDDSWDYLPAIPNGVGTGNVEINDRGLVTACVVYADGTTVAWTWDGHSYSFFSAPGADEALGGTQPLGINNLGQIAGLYYDSTGASHGFIKDGSKFTTIDVPGCWYDLGLRNQ